MEELLINNKRLLSFRGVIRGDKASLDSAQEEGYYLISQIGGSTENIGPYDHGVLEVHKMPSGVYLLQKVFNIRGRIFSRYKIKQATDWDKWYDVVNKVKLDK